MENSENSSRESDVESPDLLVLDEPVQGVDFNGEIALYGMIEKFETS